MKYTALILCAVMFIGMLCFAVGAEGTDVFYLCGDADGDGTVNLFDVTAIQRDLGGMESLVGINRKAAAVQNGELDITDATIIQRSILGIEVDVPIGVWFTVSVPNTEPSTTWYKPGENDLPFIQNP